jgi:hypothetical protein
MGNCGRYRAHIVNYYTYITLQTCSIIIVNNLYIHGSSLVHYPGSENCISISSKIITYIGRKLETAYIGRILLQQYKIIVSRFMCIVERRLAKTSKTA